MRSWAGARDGRHRRGERGADRRASDPTAIAWAITAFTAVMAMKTRIHPLWLLAAGSLIGLTGFGQV